jgi:hypothetical protein
MDIRGYIISRFLFPTHREAVRVFHKEYDSLHVTITVTKSVRKNDTKVNLKKVWLRIQIAKLPLPFNSSGHRTYC